MTKRFLPYADFKTNPSKHISDIKLFKIIEGGVKPEKDQSSSEHKLKDHSLQVHFNGESGDTY